MYHSYVATSSSHKVNSIYAETSNKAWFVEVGWEQDWVRSLDQPRFFYAWDKGLGYNDVLLEYPLIPRNHKFVTRWNGAGSYLIFFDGVQRATVPTGLTSARILANVERLDPVGGISSNYAHFYDLIKYTDSIGHWGYWVNLVPDTVNDPFYYLLKMSNTEFYSTN